MRGHDDLANRGLFHSTHQLQELDLAGRRQCGFRLVKDENALPLATLFEEAQKTFAVRMREEVRRRTATVARGLVEISGDRKEALGAKEPAVGYFWQPACAQRL